MAHPNCDERRAEVARLVSYGVSFAPVVIQALTEKVGCSPSSIRAGYGQFGLNASPISGFEDFSPNLPTWNIDVLIPGNAELLRAAADQVIDLGAKCRK
jgi:hypothetical protein